MQEAKEQEQRGMGRMVPNQAYGKRKHAIQKGTQNPQNVCPALLLGKA